MDEATGQSEARGFRDARCTDAAIHRDFLRCGISLRQSLPQVEVSHVLGLDNGDGPRSFDSFAGLPDHRVTLPGEILK
jgi:hypothetical protein